jgi:IS30 family transposase
MSYTQLTRGQRYQISILLKAGHNQTCIANLVDCHKSTISRELRRNRGQRDYHPVQANKFAHQRMDQRLR